MTKHKLSALLAAGIIFTAVSAPAAANAKPDTLDYTVKDDKICIKETYISETHIDIKSIIYDPDTNYLKFKVYGSEPYNGKVIASVSKYAVDNALNPQKITLVSRYYVDYNQENDTVSYPEIPAHEMTKTERQKILNYIKTILNYINRF